MTLEGMGACLAVEGSTTAAVFEAYYVEQVLAPTLRAGQVVVMDNLSGHKGQRVRELVEARGCELPYLPPYSRRTLTPSRKPSPRLRVFCERPKPGPVGLWSRGWARGSRRSRPRTLAASSGTAGTAGRFNRYDERCRLGYIRGRTSTHFVIRFRSFCIWHRFTSPNYAPIDT